MLNDIIKNRYSPRAFSEEKINSKTLHSLFESARWSPSSMNEQPWRFIIAAKDNPENFGKMLSVLKDTNREWAENAYLLILTITKLRNSKNNQLNRFALYDAGQAVAYLTMQASYMGLFVRQMGGFNTDRARDLFNIPEDFLPLTVMAAGYKGEINDLPPFIRERENTIRRRKPLEEIVFSEKFNSPFKFPEEEIINIEG